MGKTNMKHKETASVHSSGYPWSHQCWMKTEGQGLPGSDLVLTLKRSAQSKVNLIEKPRSLHGIPSPEENNSIKRAISAIIFEVKMETTLTAFFSGEAPTIIERAGGSRGTCKPISPSLQ